MNMRSEYKEFSKRVRAAYNACIEACDPSEFTSEAVNKIATRMNLAIDVSKLMLTGNDRYEFIGQGHNPKPGRILYLKSRKAVGL
jgi:hypothetical protein